METVFKLTHTT